MNSLSLIRCNHCRKGHLEAQSRAAVCSQCGQRYGGDLGFFDLLPRPEDQPTASSTEQRLMESELVARAYERFWRPAFVRLLAGGGTKSVTSGFEGEFFLHKNALGMDDRVGPWLDLSSGPGLFTRAMASTNPGDWVFGLDISRAMLEVAATRARGYSNIVLLRGDAHDLPFLNETMGGVNNAGALHVYDDPETVFGEVFRVLRGSGVFVGSTFAPTSSPLKNISAKLAGIRRFDSRDLRASLSRTGFSEYEEIRLGGAVVFRVKKP